MIRGCSLNYGKCSTSNLKVLKYDTQLHGQSVRRDMWFSMQIILFDQ